jgi:hypothetical protein
LTGAFLISPDNHNQNNLQAWWRPYWQLIKHVAPGLGLFFVLAIPALALDFVNQGIEMIEFQRVTHSRPDDKPNSTNQPSDPPPKVIKASRIVRYVLYGVEYLILSADVVLIIAVMVNGTWVFLKSLKW